MIHRVRIEAARGIVEDEPGEQTEIRLRKQLLEDSRVRAAQVEMVLVDQRSEPGRRRVEHRLVMIEDPGHRRRTAMAMQVHCPLQEA